MRAFVVAALCPFFAIAQQTGRVEGRVVSALDGAPLSRVSVRLIAQTANGANRTPTAYLETTAGDGRFSVEGLPPGSYQVSPQRNGYTVPEQPQLKPAMLHVVAGETNKIEILLVPLANVRGIVTDEAGDAVPGAVVRLLRPSFRLGRMMLSSITSGNADDQGEFRLANVRPGSYYLAVSGSPNNNPNGLNEVRGPSAQIGDLPTYYPSSPDIRGAAKLDVQSANIDSLRVRMRRGRTYSVKGTIVGLTLTPEGPRPTLNLNPRKGDEGPHLFAFLRPAGDFEFAGVAPGDYVIVTQLNDDANPSNITVGRAEVTVTNRDIANVTVRMADNLELSGKLTIEGVTDLSSYFAPPNPAPGFVQPSRLGTIQLMSGEAGPQIQIQDDGTFRGGNIPPLPYLVNIYNMPQRTYLKARRLNGQELTDSWLDLSSAGSGAVLELVLGTKPPSLIFKAPPGIEPPAVPPSGVATSEQLMVTVWPVKPGFPDIGGGVRTMFLQPQGNVSPSNLPPGDYFAAMWEEAPPYDVIYIPEFLAKFNSLAARVTLKEGETATVEPKVISKNASQKALAEFP